MEAVLGLSKAAPLQMLALRSGADIITRGLFNGREVGRQVFERVIRHLDQMPPDTVLPLDFGGVTFFDISCADEIICRLIGRVKAHELGGRFVILQNVDETVRENIEAALRERRMCCVIEQDGRPQVLGKLSDELKHTYELAVRRGIMTTSELQRHVPELKLNAASNRLVLLEEMGLLYKVGSERGGRTFTYQAVA